MLYPDVYVISAGLIATIILIIDLRSLRGALERDRTERIAENERRHLTELAQARLAYARHAELVGILLANIVPDRPTVEVAQTGGEDAAPAGERDEEIALEPVR